MSHPTMRETGGARSLQDAVSDQLLSERILVLGSAVDDDVANQLCARMLLLAADDPHRDVHLYVNSPGGSVDAGLAVYDTMRFIGCDVATYAFGMAASMGQFLLTAGTPGKRHALPHTRILVHQPSAGVGGTQSDIAIQADVLRRLKRQVNELQALHSGHTDDPIDEGHNVYHGAVYNGIAALSNPAGGIASTSYPWLGDEQNFIAVQDGAGLPPGQTLPAVGDTTVPLRDRLPGSGFATVAV